MKQTICGFHAVNAALWQNPGSIEAIYLAVGKDDLRSREVLQQAAGAAVKVVRVDAARLDKLTGGQRHQGIGAFVNSGRLYTHIDDVLESLTVPPLLLILDGVTDPHNLGAALRVADAMGVHAVIAPKDRSVGLNATVSKVASGAAATVPFITVTNLARTLRELKKRGIWLFGASDAAAHSLYDTVLPRGLAWIMGSEGKGLRRLTLELCDERTAIPMLGQVGSLNVAVAAGIVLAETRRQYAAGEAKGKI